MIYTVRGEYVTKNNLFTPTYQKYNRHDLLQEVALMRFNDNQLEDYLQAYVDIRRDQIPDVRWRNAHIGITFTA